MLERKLKRLITILKKMHKVAIAYSGGVDSSLLLKIAKDSLGGNVLAITAKSPTYPRAELRFACEMAKHLGIKHKVIKTRELNNPSFIKNPINRCYYCKRELFRRLWNIARPLGINFVVDGSNVSDKDDFRPGSRAKKEFKVRSPLQEAGFTKLDIRRLSQRYNLPSTNLAQAACLASRIPYGQRITRQDLRMVEQAESYLKKLGFGQVRVRHYNLNRKAKLARIEVDKEDLSRIFRQKHGIITHLKNLGYNYVTVDLEGYCCGSMNINCKL